MSIPNPSQLQEEIEFSIPIQVKFSDIDGYLHVNNGVYFSYFEHARAIFLHQVCQWDVLKVGAVVGKIEIDYFRPVHLEDQVEVLVHCTRLGNSSFDLEHFLIGKTAQGQSAVFAKCLCKMVAVDMENMRPIPIPDFYRAKLQPIS